MSSASALYPDLDWRQVGQCGTGDPDLMFPEPLDGPGVAAAKDACASCLVRTECRDWAVATRQKHGVWGGLAENELRALIRRVQRAQKKAREATPAAA